MLRRANLKNLVGSLIMAAFGALALWRWFESGSLFFLFLSAREWIASYFFLRRLDYDRPSTITPSAIAYVSSAMPLVYGVPNFVSPAMTAVFNCIVILGFLLVTFATIDLGDQIGVAPSRRGEPCRRGVYRFMNHPMYVGYAIAEVAFVLVRPTNALIYALSMTLYFVRARFESKLID